MGSTGALAGVRVVDLSRVLAGPYAGQLLADHGADVIKVEHPDGDETRRWGPPFAPDGTAAYFLGLNRGKRNLALDLAQEAGRSVLRRLVEGADVLIENFKPGTMERWGFGPDDLLAAHPSLVYCRVTGYGTGGPLAGLPGYDAVLQAESGLMSVNGEPDGDPMRIGIPVVDQTTGLHAFAGILLALVERAASGRGQVVEVSLFDTALGLLHPHAATWFLTGDTPRRVGSGHASIVPYQPFATRSGQVFVAAASDRQFQGLCEVLGRAELAVDARFATNADRVANRHRLLTALEEAFAVEEAADVVERLRARGVPAGVVNDVPAALSMDHAEARGMVVRLEGYRGVGNPITLERTATSYGLAPRPVGADSAAVLAELGFTGAQVDELLRCGAVAAS